MKDLDQTYPDLKGGRLKACFVGEVFPGFTRQALSYGHGEGILITATSTLERRLARFAVNGMFQTGKNDYDRQFVVMGLETAMDFVRSGGAVTGLNVRLDDYNNAETVRAELDERFRPGRTLRTFGDASVRVKHMALSRDGSRLAALTEAGEATVWDVETGNEVRRLPAGELIPAALAPAEYIGTDDVVLIGVKRPAGPYHGVPPAAGARY